MSIPWIRIRNTYNTVLTSYEKQGINKPVAPFPATSALCLNRIDDQHSLSTKASRIVQRQEFGRSDDVQEEFQPA
jgi:hypothetical protein